MKFFAVSMIISLTAIARGWGVLQPVDQHYGSYGVHLRSRAEKDALDNYIDTYDPDVIFYAPPYGPWTPLQHLWWGRAAGNMGSHAGLICQQ